MPKKMGYYPMSSGGISHEVKVMHPKPPKKPVMEQMLNKVGQAEQEVKGMMPKKPMPKKLP